MAPNKVPQSMYRRLCFVQIPNILFSNKDSSPNWIIQILFFTTAYFAPSFWHKSRSLLVIWIFLQIVQSIHSFHIEFNVLRQSLYLTASAHFCQRPVIPGLNCHVFGLLAYSLGIRLPFDLMSPIRTLNCGNSSRLVLRISVWLVTWSFSIFKHPTCHGISSMRSLIPGIHAHGAWNLEAEIPSVLSDLPQ